MFSRRWWWWLSAIALACIGGIWWLVRFDVGETRLRPFVHHAPPIPLVFTSRSEPASFRAAAPQGEVFVFPGQPLWQAREGRLRLLTPQGTVHELTWGKPLPDGGTVIDVMSPSISLDTKKILFAGRRADDHGHFRLYEIGIDGRGLRQLTGGAHDPGCTALPPMRYAADGRTILPDDERRRIDYDDVDPVYADAGGHTIAFASSRTPDLGRGHARRSTTLWLMHLDSGTKYPLTSNRYNDRWPFLMTSNFLAFSLWSHNQEVIAADEMDIRPHEPGMASATAPVDSWLGAFTQTVGGQFGALVKTEMPVWRPRPLFDGRIVFMTTRDYASFEHDTPKLSALRIVATDAGVVGTVPSARPVGVPLPERDNAGAYGPALIDNHGTNVGSLATPSPCPPHFVVFSGAPSVEESAQPPPGSFRLYSTREDEFFGPTGPGLTLLFDDPHLVDAEPVAVYARHSKLWPTKIAPPKEETKTDELRLANGTIYRGPSGTVFNSGLYTFQHGDLPGQKTDIGQGPIFAQPPKNSIHSIKIYASHRDRFDDPVKPRNAGEWELLIDAPVSGDSVGTRVPAGVPTVLAGFDRSGRVARWTTDAKDSKGRQASFYAFAGDHYSATRPMGKHFCIGCHPGHSSLARADHNHAEKVK